MALSACSSPYFSSLLSRSSSCLAISNSRLVSNSCSLFTKAAATSSNLCNSAFAANSSVTDFSCSLYSLIFSVRASPNIPNSVNASSNLFLSASFCILFTASCPPVLLATNSLNRCVRLISVFVNLSRRLCLSASSITRKSACSFADIKSAFLSAPSLPIPSLNIRSAVSTAVSVDCHKAVRNESSLLENS